MKSLFDLLPKLPEKKSGPNSERAEQIEGVMALMGEDVKNGKRFKYWLGRTKKLSPATIYELRKQAETGSNPPALFNYLLKKTK